MLKLSIVKVAISGGWMLMFVAHVVLADDFLTVFDVFLVQICAQVLFYPSNCSLGSLLPWAVLYESKKGKDSVDDNTKKQHII